MSEVCSTFYTLLMPIEELIDAYLFYLFLQAATKQININRSKQININYK